MSLHGSRHVLPVRHQPQLRPVPRLRLHHPRPSLPPRTTRVALGAPQAAQTARRQGSPDRDYYLQAAARLGGNRACPAVARKLLKRSYHTLRELGDEALRPA
jgi:hypothetical protein